MTNKKMIGVRDPFGIRPLVIGKLKDYFILSSETFALDIVGAKFVRIRTLVKFIDAVNFANNTNATADPNAEFPREVYYIDRKSAENRDVVTFELASVSDLAGIRLPKRQCTRDLFPSIGTFI